MKYFTAILTLAVLLAGCTALNNLAVNVDAHDAVDNLQDRYNVCYTCKLPSTMFGGNEIAALRRAGLKNICNKTPKE